MQSIQRHDMCIEDINNMPADNINNQMDLDHQESVLNHSEIVHSQSQAKQRYNAHIQALSKVRNSNKSSPIKINSNMKSNPRHIRIE